MKIFNQFCLFAIILISLSISSYCIELTMPPVISIKPEDTGFNRNYIYSNNFDSAAVIYFFGDVRINDHGSYINVPLEHTMDAYPGRWIQADGTQGISVQLMQLGKTSMFVVPTVGSTVKFYREIGETGNPCATGGNFGDYRGAWDIADQSEYVVRVLRGSDLVCVGRIDSVGSQPNSNPNYDGRYGTDVYNTHRSWNVPDSLVGVPIFLNIVPKRWGATNFGIVMKEVSTSYNLSTMHDNNGMNRAPAEIDTLELIAWNKLTTYMDSVKTSTGYLPTNNVYVPRNYKYEYKRRYMDSLEKWVHEGGDTTYVQIRYTSGSGRNPNLDNSKSAKTNEGLTTYPNPGRGGSPINLKYTSKSEFDAYVEIEGMDGKIYKNIWHGKIWSGENEISLENQNLSSGVYIINLMDNSGKIRKSVKVTVAR